MFELNILPMNENDLAEVYEIEKASFIDPWSFESFKEELHRKDSKNLVAKIDNKIVGYIIFWLVSDEIHILNIAVHPLYKNQKIGSRLLQYCLEFAKQNNFKYCTLEVRESNLLAQKLYEKFDFKSIYKRKKYYKGPEDAIVMGKKL
jgi:ribosomal-protein-alanine N-acetyltransferase